MGAFAVQGVCGLALNVLIGRFYGPASLGLFNQVFALYIFASQIAVFGFHFSAIKYVAEYRDDPKIAQTAAVSAIFLTVVATTVTTLLALAATPLLARAFQSPDFSRAWLAVMPGLWCYGVNKTLLAVMNGYLRMRAFAVAQAGRYLLLIIALSWCVWRSVPGEVLVGILSAAEIMLTMGLVLYLPSCLSLHRPTAFRSWLHRHFAFGAKACLSGAVIELNTRVDVILLGFYVDDAQVGIYSMAALFIEGGAQAFVVVRNVINPMITRAITQGQFGELRELRSRVFKMIWWISIPAGLVAIAVYPVILRYLAHDPTFEASVPVFAILMAGLVVSAGYQPFGLALVQSGFPGLQTFYMCLVLGINVLGNALFIPAWGIVGAAVATSASFVAAMPILRYLLSKRTGFTL